MDGEMMETVTDFIFLGSKITVDSDCSHEIKRCLLLGRKAMTNLDSILKCGDITLLSKVLIDKAVFFFSSHIWMWEPDNKKGWVPKNWCLQTVVLEKTLESPLGCKKIKWVSPIENQLWIFIGRTEAKAPIFWPLDNEELTHDSDSGKDWRQEEMGTTEYEMIGWHHKLNGHELEQTPGDG